MKKAQLILVLTSLALGACAKTHQSPFATPAARAAVAGTYRNDGSFKYFKEFLQINADSVTLTVLCKNSEFGRFVNFVKGDPRNEARVQVTAPARITDGTIEILADAEEHAPEIGGSCVAKLVKGVMSYTFDGAQNLKVLPVDGLEQSYTKMGVETPSLTERAKAGIAKGTAVLGRAAKSVVEGMGRYPVISY